MERKRVRDKGICIWVTQDEYAQIRERMSEINAHNLSGYMRKMAVDGMILNVNIPEISEMVTLLRRSSSLLNQIAARANETGRVYEIDLMDAQNTVDAIWLDLNNILKKLIRVSELA